MKELLNSELFIILLNISIFSLAISFIKIFKIRYLNGLLISIPLILLILNLLDIDIETYNKGSRMLNFLLGPSVVALGYLIHKNIKQIGKNIFPLIIAVGVGAIVNSILLNLVFHFFDVSLDIIASLHPKSVTTPIALELSSRLGGIPSLTILSVVIAGILGSIIGVPLLDKLKIKNKIARGAALGAASHAIGTARALELGTIEGAVSGLVIGIMGFITALLPPYVHTWFL